MTQQANCAFTAPHKAATEAGLSILKQGGSATEAMIAAAAMISVVYPHMTGIGGDSFWLIDNLKDDGKTGNPFGIDATGRASAQASTYPEQTRGGNVALTQAGTLRGWALALENDPYRQFDLATLLQPSIDMAERGFTVTDSLEAASNKLAQEQGPNTAFRKTFEPQGKPLKAGDHFINRDFANTLHTLADKGIEDFYTGSLSKTIAQSLKASGSSLTASDLANTKAEKVTLLSVDIENATLYNLPAPTPGVSSLMILAIADRLKAHAKTESDWVHLLVEATKQSFYYRDKVLADPEYVGADYHRLLDDDLLDSLAKNIDLSIAQPWPRPAEPGDTVWMGATDRHGQMVSFIQSIYWEFGAGVCIDNAGFVWNNRSLGFDPSASSVNALSPNKKPKQTLNPAFARFHDGRRLVYGTMGGEGQPQTQSAIFSRYFWRNQSLTDAIHKGRWLLGKTWGDTDIDLKIESDLAEVIGDVLNQKQHNWRTVPASDELMGHAGAIATQGEQVIDLATDPRSDGEAKAANVA